MGRTTLGCHNNRRRARYKSTPKPDAGSEISVHSIPGMRVLVLDFAKSRTNNHNLHTLCTRDAGYGLCFRGVRCRAVGDASYWRTHMVVPRDEMSGTGVCIQHNYSIPVLTDRMLWYLAMRFAVVTWLWCYQAAHGGSPESKGADSSNRVAPCLWCYGCAAPCPEMPGTEAICGATGVLGDVRYCDCEHPYSATEVQEMSGTERLWCYG
eukprot:1945935-Rhodomonas_salina.1